jgi:hypothetical protein
MIEIARNQRVKKYFELIYSEATVGANNPLLKYWGDLGRTGFLKRTSGV